MAASPLDIFELFYEDVLAKKLKIKKERMKNGKNISGARRVRARKAGAFA